MPRRSENRRISSARRVLSPQIVLEFCRQPKLLAVAAGVVLIAFLAVFAFQSDSDSVADANLTDEQLESDFLALGALGVSDSANPSAGGVNPDFDFDRDDTPELLDSGTPSAFLAHSADSRMTPDFDPPGHEDMPRFGRPIVVTDPRSESTVEQAGFEQASNAPTEIVGARVTANQAVWLTGSIETQ